MSEYISELKAEGYPSLRETFYNEQRASFPALGSKQPSPQLDYSQVDHDDQQVDTEDNNGPELQIPGDELNNMGATQRPESLDDQTLATPPNQ